MRLAELLDRMAKRSQSVMLNYGEEDALWECSWITGGKRFSAFAKDPYSACYDAERAARRFFEKAA